MAKQAWGAMRDNFRRMYQKEYNTPFTGDDDVLDKIIADVGTLSTGEEQDNATLYDMGIWMSAHV